MLDELLLDRMQATIRCKPFDRGDLDILLSNRQSEAAQHAPPVQYDCARAALTVVTTFLGPGETDMFAQHVQEADPWFQDELMGDAIDMQCDARWGRHALAQHGLCHLGSRSAAVQTRLTCVQSSWQRPTA